MRARLPTMDQLALVDVRLLSPDPDNPKVHDRGSIDGIKRAVLEVGLVQPFVARAHDLVVAGDGNGRLLACRELLQEGHRFAGPDGVLVPVLWGHWDPETWPLVNLALNNLKASPDGARLRSLVEDLKESLPVQRVKATGVHPAIVDPPQVDLAALERVKAEAATADRQVVLTLSPPVFAKYVEWRGNLDDLTARDLTDTEVLELLMEALGGTDTGAEGRPGPPAPGNL